jgi:site-specific DNA-methyltransferase (adenine-specific)
MIPARCFSVATDPADIVLDPFGGGGSSYEAAESIKRHWLGSEIVDCEHIIARLKERFPDSAGKAPTKKLLGVFR